MSDPFIAEIRLFGGNFAPRGWAFCEGQLLSIAQNTALFSLIGTSYGGDGLTTFSLPDLRGRAPVHPGQGPGLDSHMLGEQTGSSTVILTSYQMPVHNHEFNASNGKSTSTSPDGNTLGTQSLSYQNPVTSTLVGMATQSVRNSGGGQAHNNMQPYLAVNFIIALMGIYPPRS